MPNSPQPRRVRIAVVDSGVEPAHDHITAARLQPGVSFRADGTMEKGAEATRDQLGHGTAVTAAIQQWAPDADITPVRVFTTALTTSPRALIKAVQYCIDHQFDLVNLSLGTRVPDHAPLFAQAAEIAREEGVVLVAARSVEEEPCYPGCLDDALGVGLDWDLPRDAFRYETGSPVLSPLGAAHVLASGYPRPIPGVAQQRNLFGVSFSVANMTGLAAAVLQKAPQFENGEWDDFSAPKDRLADLQNLLRANALSPAS